MAFVDLLLGLGIAFLQLIVGLALAMVSVYLGIWMFDKLTQGIEELKELKDQIGV